MSGPKLTTQIRYGLRAITAPWHAWATPKRHAGYAETLLSAACAHQRLGESSVELPERMTKNPATSEAGKSTPSANSMAQATRDELVHADVAELDSHMAGLSSNKQKIADLIRYGINRRLTQTATVFWI
ncbi:MAG TPA: hypothetical protein VLC92_17650 [Rhodocyclaceae bacterium]|nr:hypothetical protein [Rhodocyclaceae bacterium]